jgi:hypothetical protein
VQSPLTTFVRVSSPMYWPSNLADPCAHATLPNPVPSRRPSPRHLSIPFFPIRISLADYKGRARSPSPAPFPGRYGATGPIASPRRGERCGGDGGRRLELREDRFQHPDPRRQRKRIVGDGTFQHADQGEFLVVGEIECHPFRALSEHRTAPDRSSALSL